MKLKVLSIDGGGVRGIVPAVILEYIENKIIEITGKKKARISDYLDFTAGTSTGSIISSMILVPDKDGRPLYKMEDIINSYFDLAEVVFKKSILRDIKTLWGIFGPRYSTKNIDSQLLIKYNHTRMKDLLKPCCFTGYDVDKRKPVIYTNKDKSRKYENYFVKDIIRGSTSIPSVFQPAYFRDGVDINTIVDGGVFANNPSMVAYVEVSKEHYSSIFEKTNVDPANILMLSFGTGISKLKKYKYDKVKKWGMLKWFFPIINILLQGVGEVTEYEMEKLYSAYNAKENFIRINPPIILGNSDGKDSSKHNLIHLRQDALNYISANKVLLDNIANELTKEEMKYKKLI